MDKKYPANDSVSSSTGENKTSINNQRESEVSAISSERVQSVQQNSIKSDLSSSRQPVNRDRKDSEASRVEVSHGETVKTSSSKESNDILQLSSVDSVDLKPCQSSNGNTAEKKVNDTRQDASEYSQSRRSDGSLCVQQPDSSHMITKTDLAVDSVSSKLPCEFDLNEESFCDQKSSVEEAAVVVSEPIPVVAKIGVPIGLPKKPLQFDGELGWRRSTNTSAFRPAFSKSSGKEIQACGSKQSLASQGIDLNIAATMDSELDADETSLDVSLKQTGGFDLNDDPNPGVEDTTRNINQLVETQQASRDNTAANSTTGTIGNGNSQCIPDTRSHPYWVDLRSMQGFNHVQARPFLMASPATDQVRMVVPIQSSEISFLPHTASGLDINKVHNLSPTFYPPPHLSNQHPVIPHLSGSVLTAYRGAVHVLDSPQVLYPATYATPMRPTFTQNGTIAFMDNATRGAGNVEFLVPARNALLDERMKSVEPVSLPPTSTKRREPDGGWDYSQVHYRPMASWK